MGREVGGGIGMGKTYEPKAFSFQCMTKFTTKKIKKNLTIKKKKKKNAEEGRAIPFSRGFSQPRDQTQVSCLQADALP